MPAERTVVTELATALGMVGPGNISEVLERRPDCLRPLSETDWRMLTGMWSSGQHSSSFRAGFANGQAFLRSPDALAGRLPRLIEWTGGRRAPGDEVVPADLRVDHVYLISCKYLSRILHNASPARLVDGLLTHAPVDDLADWFQRVAPDETQDLYRSCIDALEASSWPARVADLDVPTRRLLARELRDGWPAGAGDAYRRLTKAVSEATASMWRAQMSQGPSEPVLWRILRVGSAPYFILGSADGSTMRLRVETPWDWRHNFALKEFTVFPQEGGQPRVGWRARCTRRSDGSDLCVEGHVEIRWSHGRFAQPPEAKVYLDTPHSAVPGYNLL